MQQGHRGNVHSDLSRKFIASCAAMLVLGCFPTEISGSTQIFQKRVDPLTKCIWPHLPEPAGSDTQCCSYNMCNEHTGTVREWTVLYMCLSAFLLLILEFVSSVLAPVHECAKCQYPSRSNPGKTHRKQVLKLSGKLANVSTASCPSVPLTTRHYQSSQQCTGTN